MKILHIITSLKIGGAEAALYNFLEKRNINNEHLVAYFYLGPNLEKIQKLGIKTFHISGPISIYDPIALFRLSRLIRKEKPQIIHTALWSANIIGRILGRLHNIPTISELHGNISDFGKVRKILEIATAPLASRIISVSNSVKHSYEDSIKERFSKSKVNSLLEKHITIHNGIDSTELILKAKQNPLSRSELNLEADDFVIGAVGRLEKIKSYDVLIKAFSLFLKKCKNQNQKVEKLKLLIIGDGRERAELEKLAESLNLKNNIMFLGFRLDAYRFYPLFDCFAISSQSEGLSIALLEAVSFNLPIISTHKDLKIHHDIIENHKNGILIENNDVKNYAKSIFEVFINKNFKKTAASYNKTHVRDKFCISKNVIKYENIYKMLAL